MPVCPRLAVGSVVDEKPLGLALDAFVWPAFALGVVAIGVGQFPIGGYRYFLPFFFLTYFYIGVTLVTLVMRDSVTRSVISLAYSVSFTSAGETFLLLDLHHTNDLCLGQPSCA